MVPDASDRIRRADARRGGGAREDASRKRSCDLQKEHDQFDEQSRRFLGDDEVFRQRFNDVEEGQRYLHPDEIRNFVEGYVAEVVPALEVRELPKRPKVFNWSGRGVDALYEAIRQQLLVGETTELEWQLAGRLCGQQRVPSTFDGDRNR